MAQAEIAAPAVGEATAIVGYFEVHVRRDDRWMIDSTSRLADDAIAEAMDLVKRSEVLAVKVVHERYNPGTDRSASRIIYDFAKPKRRRSQTYFSVGRSPSMPAAQATSANPPPAPALDAAAATATRRPAARPAAPSPAMPWSIFALATLALATAATLLFVFLALVG